MRIIHAKHEFAAQARRTDAGARGHFVERGVLGRNESVTRIFAFAHCHEFEPFGQFHRNVLEGVNREVSFTLLHRHFEFLDEETLAAHLRERAVENLVAAGRHAEELDLGAGILPTQDVLNVKSLPHGQGAFSRSDDAAFEFRHRFLSNN